MSETVFDKASTLKVSFKEYQQDLVKRGRSRLLSQFFNSSVLNQLLDSISAECDELYTAGEQVLSQRTIAEAGGVNLDVLGDIVGQPRTLANAGEQAWLTPDLSAKSPDRGFAWIDGVPVYGLRTADDQEYRQIILAKIFKNHICGASTPEVRYFAKVLMGFNISFVKTGLLKVALAVPDSIVGQDLSLLLSIIRNEQIDYSYFLPIPPAVELDETVYYIVAIGPTGRGQSFAPDMDSGKPDFAYATVKVKSFII